MYEIWIPELIITIFILIYFMRPFVKGLWPLDGLVWLPVLVLIITVGIFAAYGFRPECVPLLFFEFILTVGNLPALVSSAASLTNEDFRDRKPVFTLVLLFFVGCAIAIMFIFSPKVPADLVSTEVETKTIRDISCNADYFVRIYGNTGSESRPLLFLIPPEAGSIPAVDMVCTALTDRGFLVVSYSRRGFDFPSTDANNRRFFASPSQIYACWSAFRQGTELKIANDKGKMLEAERLRDIEFLLPRLRTLMGEGREKTPLFLAGYGAGGSAALLFAGNSGFSGRFPAVQGIITVESRFWSAYRSEPPVLPEIPSGASWYRRSRVRIANWFASFGARRVSGFEPLLPSGIPLLCVVSDRALSSAFAANPYRALPEILRSTKAEIQAVAGAGPLDFCAYPLTHPVYSFLFPGTDRTAKSYSPINDIAGLIGCFTTALPEQEMAELTEVFEVGRTNELINNGYFE